MSLCNYILFVIVTVLFFKYIWQKRNMLKKFRHFHTIPSRPVIGHLHYLSTNWKERATIFINLMKICPLPAVAWIFNLPLVVVGTGDDIQTVLNQSNDRALLNKFKHSFGDGILLNEGEKWRRSRRVISQMFSVSMMQHYLKVFNQHSARLSQKMQSFANTHEIFDMSNYALYANIDIIFDNMADYRPNILENEDEHIVQLIERSVQLDSMRYTQPFLFPDFIYNAYLYITGQWKVFAELHEFVSKVIRAKLEEYELNQSRQPDTLRVTGKKNRNLLDALIEAHHTDPDHTFDCVKDDFLNIILAGSGTTSRTACFALLMLAIHQDVQDKLYQEIKSIFGSSNRAVEMDDINQLIYLDQCVKETLRKYPVIPLTFRTHHADIVLNEKQTIPASTDIVIGTYALHHNEQLYPNPESWDPDRFAPEVAEKRDKLAFLPFGTGPQSCIGAKYAMISLKTQLVHLLRSYRFDTDMTMDDIKLCVDVALKPADGYLLKLWPREH